MFSSKFATTWALPRIFKHFFQSLLQIGILEAWLKAMGPFWGNLPNDKFQVAFLLKLESRIVQIVANTSELPPTPNCCQLSQSRSVSNAPKLAKMSHSELNVAKLVHNRTFCKLLKIETGHLYCYVKFNLKAGLFYCIFICFHAQCSIR